MHRLLNRALLAAALAVPIAVAPMALRADDHDRDHHERVYHDRDHNDDHHWDDHENRAYRMYVKEQHRRYENFERLREEDQAAYWRWRHEHSDAILKIDIR